MLVTSIFKAVHTTVPEFLKVPVTVVRALTALVLYVLPLGIRILPLILAVVVFAPSVIFNDPKGIIPCVNVEPVSTIKSALRGPLLLVMVRVLAPPLDLNETAVLLSI